MTARPPGAAAGSGPAAAYRPAARARASATAFLAATPAAATRQRTPRRRRVRADAGQVLADRHLQRPCRVQPLTGDRQAGRLAASLLNLADNLRQPDHPEEHHGVIDVEDDHPQDAEPPRGRQAGHRGSQHHVSGQQAPGQQPRQPARHHQQHQPGQQSVDALLPGPSEHGERHPGQYRLHRKHRPAVTGQPPPTAGDGPQQRQHEQRHRERHLARLTGNEDTGQPAGQQQAQNSNREPRRPALIIPGRPGHRGLHPGYHGVSFSARAASRIASPSRLPRPDEHVTSRLPRVPVITRTTPVRPGRPVRASSGSSSEQAALTTITYASVPGNQPTRPLARICSLHGSHGA